MMSLVPNKTFESPKGFSVLIQTVVELYPLGSPKWTSKSQQRFISSDLNLTSFGDFPSPSSTNCQHYVPKIDSHSTLKRFARDCLANRERFEKSKSHSISFLQTLPPSWLDLIMSHTDGETNCKQTRKKRSTEIIKHENWLRSSFKGNRERVLGHARDNSKSSTLDQELMTFWINIALALITKAEFISQRTQLQIGSSPPERGAS